MNAKKQIDLKAQEEHNKHKALREKFGFSDDEEESEEDFQIRTKGKVFSS